MQLSQVGCVGMSCNTWRAANSTKYVSDLAHTDDSDSGSDTGFAGVGYAGSVHGQDRLVTKTTLLLLHCLLLPQLSSPATGMQQWC